MLNPTLVTLQTNASIVRDLVKTIGEVAPKAKICIISNPVNSTVPVFAEVFKAAGTYDAKRLFGVTTLDVVRASTFVSSVAGKEEKASECSSLSLLPFFSSSQVQR